MDYIKITFADLQPEQKEILIAQLADAGYEGFEETENKLDAYIVIDDFDTTLLNEISFKYQAPYTSTNITETNWNEIWESNFEPVVVGDFVAVRADFHKPITSTMFEIVITPKMSFGTGHHATTYMMIEMMKEIDFRKKTVLDFGTGTGILAILAEKSGSETIHAIDNDDWSIENAKENFKKNSCAKIILSKAAAVFSDLEFDIILANINKNVILENFSSLCNQLKSSGVILFSGLLEADKDEIVSMAAKFKLSLKKELTRDKWICLYFTH